MENAPGQPGHPRQPGQPGQPGQLVGRTLGDYQLVALLGVGGMAEVYQGMDVALQRQVAVKVLPASLAADTAYVERFRREAQRIAALDHPNIVPIYRYGEDRGYFYLAMPLLHTSLGDEMSTAGIVPVPEAVTITLQIADALAAAHAQGIIHRDVKPENILLTTDRRAVLTDFGIARDVPTVAPGKRSITSHTGLPLGTPEYMAPEQLRGRPFDARADVYSLGVVLYEALTLRRPHPGESVFELMEHMLANDIPLPSRLNYRVGPELERVILRALAPEPEDRFPSMPAFADALRAAASVDGVAPLAGAGGEMVRADGAGFHQALTVRLDGSTPSWRDPAIPTRPVHPSRRRALAVTIGLAALLAVVAGSIMVTGPFTRRPASLTTATPSASNTTTVGGGPAATTSVSGARATPSTSPGAIDGAPTTTATQSATPAPTATVTSTPTVTGPAPLELGYTDIALTQPRRNVCAGTQTITNDNDSAVGWQWTGPTSLLLFGIKYRINSQSMVSGMPQSATPARATDTLYFEFNCGKSYSATVTMRDDNGITYSFRIHQP